MKLSKIIAEVVDYEKYNDYEREFAKELDSKFKGNPSVSMVDYSQDREDSDPLKGKGTGTISFRMRDEFSNSTWQEIINYVKAKGYRITSDSNYYDIEPGEREWFPRITFEFEIK